MTFRFSNLLKNRWRFLPGVLASLIILVLSQLGVLDDLENASYRWLFQSRGERPWDSRVVLVAIDDATFSELGQFPLPREVYTQLLNRLAVSRPRVIGFNLLFAEPSPADPALAAAIAQAGNVVLATGTDERGRPLVATHTLRSAAIATGHVRKQVASDGLVHTVEPLVASETAFGMTLAEVYSLTQAPVTLPPLDQPLWINWPGSTHTLPQYSLNDVIAGRISPTVFEEKIVIVGMTATGIDALLTPFDQNPPAGGVVMQAAILDNLLQQHYLQPISAPGLWVLLLVAMPGVSYFIIGRPLRWQLLMVSGSLMGWLCLSVVLFRGDYLLPRMPPFLLVGITGISAIFSQQLRANLALQKLLEDLWQHYHHSQAKLTLGPASSRAIPKDLGNEVQKLGFLANALGWAEATQSAISESVPIGMLAVDDRDQVWFCNSLATRYLEMELGARLTQTLVPRWLERARFQAIIQNLLQGIAITPIECQQGATWFELRFQVLEGIAQPSPLLEDERRFFLVLIEDITHRKGFELQLRLLNEGLESEVKQRTKELERTNLNLVQEISERRQAQDKLHYQALHDKLTGLPNRASLESILAELIAQPHRAENSKFAVFFVDCDRFKLVNDSFGHWVGDELLKAIAQSLRRCVAATDLVCRFGGDEFVILLTDVPNARSAVQVARRIQQQLQNSFIIQDQQFYSSCSIGIVLSNPSYTQAEDILRDADIAMYRAKRSGSGYAFFEPKMHLAVRSSLQLETDLHQSLRRHEFVVYYQPIFSLESKQIKGFEALLRWHHPTHGMIGPGQFIPIAEETGLIVQIGEWILQEACSQMQLWQQRKILPADTFMSVNLSVQQFNDPHLLNRIDETLQLTHLNGKNLKLEITESALMTNSDAAIKILHRLKNRGISLSIDDFGTGYSSLNYLHCFPIDVLKVDQSFIQQMVKGQKHLSLVQAIRTLAYHFDMVMIAEGIETEAQMDCLKEMDCILGQGYLFCPPVDYQTLEAKYLQCFNEV